MGSIAVLCMMREPAARRRAAPTPLQVPAVGPNPPKTRTHAENDCYGRRARTPGGTGIAATARSASLPRLTGLPQFHPEDAERSEA